MSDDRIGDHCWGMINPTMWRKGHLRKWISNPGDDPTAIFEDKNSGKVFELSLEKLNFESDMPE